MAHAEAHSPNRKTYWLVFLALFVLTILEVGLTYVHTHKGIIIFLLVSLALTKAAAVLLWYMHLIQETVTLKYTVLLPFAFPALYAFVLCFESGWRAVWGT